MKLDKSELNPVLQDDILRYKKNTFAGRLALLALVFNCLYFMLFYSVPNGNYNTPLLGLSVITNLMVLLFGFFCSEGIKGYNGKFAYALFVLAAVQVARIFIFPLRGMRNDWLRGNFYFGMSMKSGIQGVLLIVYLAASAACFIVSGVQGLITAQRLVSFQKKLDSGELSVEKTLKELDAADAAAASVNGEAPAAEAPVEETPVEETPVEEVSAKEAPVESEITPDEEGNNG